MHTTFNISFDNFITFSIIFSIISIVQQILNIISIQKMAFQLAKNFTLSLSSLLVSIVLTTSYPLTYDIFLKDERTTS